MKEIVNARIPRPIQKLLKSQKDKTVTLTEALQELKYKCPACGKRWESDDKRKENIAVRIDPKVAEKVNELENPSKYICAALQVYFGFCPVCGQEKK
jgi:hypothetical protein